MSYADFSNNICHKTQKAAKAMIQAAIAAETISLMPSASVFSGMESGTITSARAVCVCKQAEQQTEEIHTGIWSVALSIQIVAPAADYPTDDDFHALCGETFALFFQAPDTVCTQLSNSTIEYTALAVYPRTQSWDLVDDTWESTLSVTVKCCGSNVA